MPQHRLKYLGNSEGFQRAQFQSYDAADDDFVANPADNHVAALQNLIYAHFAAASDESTKGPLPEEDGALEQTVLLVSRVAGIVAVIAVLTAIAIAIF